MNAVQSNVFNIMTELSTGEKELPSDNAAIFATFLQNMMSSENESMETVDTVNVEAEELEEEQETIAGYSLEELTELLAEMGLLQQPVHAILDEIANVVDMDDSPSLRDFVMNATESDGEEMNPLHNKVAEMLQQIVGETGDVELEVDESLLRSFNNLVTALQDVIQQLHEGQPKEEVASRLLPLLKAWSAISKQMDKQPFQQMAMKQLPKETVELMEKLTELYEKRQHFSAKKIYGQDANVTSKDVARWLADALPQSQPDQPTQTRRIIPTLSQEQISTPRMSVLEQHTIHVNSGERVERVQQELTQQISNIIQQSKFIQRGGLSQELSIVLKPEHLGAMTIKFTQVNNELMVKIITTSGVTRDLLEGNMQQLKHVFSPHQVQVVRDDTIINEEMMASQEEEEKNAEENEEEQLNEQEDESEQENIDFAELFQQLQEEGAFAHD